MYAKIDMTSMKANSPHTLTIVGKKKKGSRSHQKTSLFKPLSGLSGGKTPRWARKVKIEEDEEPKRKPSNFQKQ